MSPVDSRVLTMLSPSVPPGRVSTLTVMFGFLAVKSLAELLGLLDVLFLVADQVGDRDRPPPRHRHWNRDCPRCTRSERASRPRATASPLVRGRNVIMTSKGCFFRASASGRGSGRGQLCETASSLACRASALGEKPRGLMASTSWSAGWSRYALELARRARRRRRRSPVPGPRRRPRPSWVRGPSVAGCSHPRAAPASRRTGRPRSTRACRDRPRPVRLHPVRRPAPANRPAR